MKFYVKCFICNINHKKRRIKPKNTPKPQSQPHHVHSKYTTPHQLPDKTTFSNGDLYTMLTDKKAKGKKGALVAMVKGTKGIILKSCV